MHIHYLHFNACMILYKRLWNFIEKQIIFNSLLYSNEPSQIMLQYFVTYFEADLSII